MDDTNQRLDSLQSLATEVAMTYGVLRYHPAAFDQSDNPADAQDAFDRSVEQYTFLKRNAAAIAISSGGLRLMPSMSFADSTYTPAIWPVLGHITDSFGERLDPFSGEGAFHTGVDVSADYGDAGACDGRRRCDDRGKSRGLRPAGGDRSRIWNYDLVRAPFVVLGDSG